MNWRFKVSFCLFMVIFWTCNVFAEQLPLHVQIYNERISQN